MASRERLCRLRHYHYHYHYRNECGDGLLDVLLSYGAACSAFRKQANIATNNGGDAMTRSGDEGSKTLREE